MSNLSTLPSPSTAQIVVLAACNKRLYQVATGGCASFASLSVCHYHLGVCPLLIGPPFTSPLDTTSPPLEA
jgi:hypothetical protein